MANKGNENKWNKGNSKGQSNNLKEITSPYNFVPVSDKVAKAPAPVYYDLPFEDGLSGRIKIKITAKTPIYIRNGGDWKDLTDKQKKDDEQYLSFFNINKKPMIPGSSIRGMIRNVFEILTYSKLQTTDTKFSIRDLYLPLYTKALADVRGGFMYYTKNGKIYLEEYAYYPIRHEELAKYCERSIIGNKQVAKTKKKEFEKEALPALKQRGIFKNGRYRFSLSGNNAILDAKGDKEGQIVFTGQPVTYKFDRKKGIKKREVIFDLSTKPRSTYEIPKELYQAFHRIHAKTSQRDDDTWDTYYKPMLKKGMKIPVFFILDEEEKHVRSFGLAKMFRLMNPNSPADLRPKEHKTADIDWAESLFGYTSEEKESQKGRLCFKHATLRGQMSLKDASMREKVSGVLSSPKPTYYPAYLQQKGSNGNLAHNVDKYNTYMNPGAKIRGWKRYPVTSAVRSENLKTPDKVKNPEKLQTHFKPLKKGSEFEAEIIYQNLKPEELGALLFSLEPVSNFSHSLGMAKPGGYGVVTLQIEEIESRQGDSLKEKKNDYIKAYIHKISELLHRSPLVEEFFKLLIEMGSVDLGGKIEDKLSYMALTDFAKSKGSKTRRDQRKILKKYNEFFTDNDPDIQKLTKLIEELKKQYS